MEPATTAALISAGGALLGGMMGRSKPDTAWARQAQHEDMLWNPLRMVRGAQNAGLHPLFALGGGASQTPPITSAGEYDPMPEAISHAANQVARSFQSRHERQMEQLQYDIATGQLEKTRAEIDLLNSEAARNRQQSVYELPWVRPDDYVDPVSYAVVRPMPKDEAMNVRELSLQEDGSVSNFGTAANPGFQRYNMAPGFEMLLPHNEQGDASQALESVSESVPLLAMVIQRNIDQYGPDWEKRIPKQLYGVKGFAEALEMVTRARDKVYSEVGSWGKALKRFVSPDSRRREPGYKFSEEFRK